MEQLLAQRKSVHDMTAEEIEQLQALHDSFRPRWITPTVQVGPLMPSDRDDLLKYLNDPRIVNTLVGPPKPYLPEHADGWIRTRIERLSLKGSPLECAIRDMEKGGKLIGAVRVSDGPDDQLEGDDVGYWLAAEYHGQGLMAKALKLMLQDISIKEAGKRKFNAHAHIGNWASRRTLEKAGFVYLSEVHLHGLQIWRFRQYLTEEDLAVREVAVEAVPLPSLS
ncbi:hypothetical protein EMPS_06799 [Entomortierella parvispora]|uniref:N-acetyltransferase domain-containing protein n=1 Tax=Entomortierella parvispora TaxID=205924 RepID=A0A9P3LXK4_9FUNG|nr:hypothetical protein EMPS_06799 [Entomortierella parvispora]